MDDGTRCAYGQAMAELDRLLAIETDECVIWPYALHIRDIGYPSIRLADGTQLRGHVEACRRAHGERPDERHEVAHSCGVNRCVNGRHLRWATRLDNVADMYRHGRQKVAEQHGAARLTNEQVLTMRRLHDGGMNCTRLGEMFGIGRSHAWMIVNRKVWRSI